VKKEARPAGHLDVFVVRAVVAARATLLFGAVMWEWQLG
jgi:hypothetical protein